MSLPRIGTLTLGGGCFWCTEAVFERVRGIIQVQSGYCNGAALQPTYEQVCTGRTGHNEVVLVVFDPAIVLLTNLLKIFWQGHNPTLGMRQGNDIGTQYRSGIYCFDENQLIEAKNSALCYQQALDAAGMASITTEILPAPIFYYAEDYHQQYLAKNPGGYCPNITYQATGLPTFPS